MYDIESYRIAKIQLFLSSEDDKRWSLHIGCSWVYLLCSPTPSHQPASQVNSTLPVSKSWNVLSLEGQKWLCLLKMQKLSTNNHSRVTTKLLKHLSQLTWNLYRRFKYLVPPKHCIPFPYPFQSLPLDAFIFPPLSPAPHPFILWIDLASVEARKDLSSSAEEEKRAWTCD